MRRCPGPYESSRCRRRARRDQDHHVLHVRVPLRHPRAPAGRRGALHRREPRASHQPGRDLRQGLVRDHEAGFAGAPDAAAQAAQRRRTRGRRLRADFLGRGLRTARGTAGEDSRERPEAVRALHRARPDAGAHRPLRAPVRHAELRRARRLLLGEHGRGDDLHDRRLVLGVRRTRSRAREALRDDRHRRGPSFQPAQDRHFQIQAPRGPLRFDQPGAHGVLGDRRRMGADPPGHRRRAAARDPPRGHRARPVRPGVPRALHQRRTAGESGGGGGGLRPHGARPRGRGREARVRAQPGVVGPAYQQAGRHTHRRRGSVSPGRFPHARRAPGQARVSAARRAGEGVYARMGRGHYRRACRDHPPARSRDGHRRARRENRTDCRSPGPTAGGRNTSRSPAIRWLFTPCAGSPRTRTDSRRPARSRS